MIAITSFLKRSFNSIWSIIFQSNINRYFNVQKILYFLVKLSSIKMFFIMKAYFLFLFLYFFRFFFFTIVVPTSEAINEHNSQKDVLKILKPFVERETWDLASGALVDIFEEYYSFLFTLWFCWLLLVDIIFLIVTINYFFIPWYLQQILIKFPDIMGLNFLRTIMVPFRILLTHCLIFR